MKTEKNPNVKETKKRRRKNYISPIINLNVTEKRRDNGVVIREITSE